MPSSNQKLSEGSALVNSLNLEPLPIPQIPINPPMASDSFIPSLISPLKQRSPLDLSPMKHNDQPAVLYPMNLSLNQQLNPINEPMDLSNDKSYENCVSITKIEPPKIVIESDDDDDLKIIENNNHEKEEDKKHIEVHQEFYPKTENLPVANDGAENTKFFVAPTEQGRTGDVKMEDISFHSMTSRLSELDKMEPSKDLPMEILQSPDI